MDNDSKPLISIIVIFYNMTREAPRTLYTLTPEYQNVDSSIYEVLIVDNGSTEPLSEEHICSMSNNFKFIHLDNYHPSPVYALNKAVQFAQGDFLCFMIDGARMLSPGILKYAIQAYENYENPVVGIAGFHLGPDQQTIAVQTHNYNQSYEDEMLNSIDWMNVGYELFRISVFAASSQYGWFCPMAESNSVFVKRKLFNDLGGFDEKFNYPGGGTANLDFYLRACHHSSSQVVVVFGEATFHQFHNGASTGKVAGDNAEQEWNRNYNQYKQIRGEDVLLFPTVKFDLIGHLNEQAIDTVNYSIAHRERFKRQFPKESNLFDTNIYTD